MFSSHQLELVERICDAVVIINRGRLVASGRVGELRSKHSRRLVRVKVQAAHDAWHQGLRGAQVVQSNGAGVILQLDDNLDEQVVLDAARSAGRVLHFEIVRPRLSELFREVVEQEGSVGEPAKRTGPPGFPHVRRAGSPDSGNLLEERKRGDELARNSACGDARVNTTCP